MMMLEKNNLEISAFLRHWEQKKVEIAVAADRLPHRGFRSIGTSGGDDPAWIVPSGSKPWRR